MRGGYSSAIEGDTYRAGGGTIGVQSRTSKCLYKGGEKAKVPKTKAVGQTGECGKAGVSRGAHPVGTGMYNNGVNS